MDLDAQDTTLVAAPSSSLLLSQSASPAPSRLLHIARFDRSGSPLWQLRDTDNDSPASRAGSPAPRLSPNPRAGSLPPQPAPPARAFVVTVPELDGTGMALYQPFGVVLCLSCGYNVHPDNVNGHLEDKHKVHTFTKEAQTALIDKYALRVRCPKPDDGGEPFPYLKTHQGWKCTLCPWKTASKTESRKHRSKHPEAHAQCVEPVVLQEFYARSKHSGYVAVAREPPAPPSTTSALLAQLMAQHWETYRPPVLPNKDARKLHPFLVTSGWAKWLQGMDKVALTTLQAFVVPRKTLSKDCLTMMRTAWEQCAPGNYSVRCRLNSST